MEEVWFFFKLIEASLGAACMIFHIQGFLDDRQPLPHEMYFCGTFFGFTMIAIFGNIGISLGSKPSIFIEAIVSAVAAVFFIISSIFSMYHAERDFHLMYLSDYEESVHPFFAISKKQSITSLSCGLLYMLHAILAIDALLITEDTLEDPSSGSMAISRADLECHQPIKLYICGKTIHEMLQRQRWFQKLTGQELRDIRDQDVLLGGEKKQRIIRDVKFVRKENII